MRYFLLLTVIILASAQTGRSQCAPNNPSGNIGFFPSTDLLACVDRGVYYDETFYLENVDSFVFQGFGTIRVDTFRIDSIGNIPCNLNWISDRGNNTYLTGQTGCIRVYGITNDTVGQYELKVYVTIVATILGKLQGDINKIIDDLESLAGPLGVDFEYYIRVKEPVDPCPMIDRNTNTPLARTAQESCTVAGLLSAKIVGDTIFCRGNTGQLNLALSNVTNPAIEWIPASAVTDPNAPVANFNLTNSAYITAQITDTADTDYITFDRVWIQIDTALPSATFIDTINGRNIKLQSTSTNGTSYSWDLGDQTTETGQVVLHTYAADGVYPVTLTVTNSCGTDVHYDTFTIGTVGIGTPDAPALRFNLFPNPAHGTVTVSINDIPGLDEYTIMVLDISGKQVLQPLTVRHQPHTSLDVSVASLPAGIYIFQIKSLHSSSFNKLVIY